MAYSLEELDGKRLKAIFDAAFLDCSLDDDDDLLVQGEVKVTVRANPQQKMLKISTFFVVSIDRLKLLEFCNKFNGDRIVGRAFFYDPPDGDGSRRPLIFDYDFVVMPEDGIEPKTIITLVRRFSDIVVEGIRANKVGLF